VTDEASAVERLGVQPLLVRGAVSNLKITTPQDVALAEFYLSHRAESD
jgi:2-C-methyl-D-erythritol 4-phosphate cytidylyltransferase